MDTLMEGTSSDGMRQRIRMLRLKKKYSQEYMGACLFVSQNAYSKLERGLTSLTVDRIRDIATILEVTVDEIIKGTPPPPSAGG